MTKGRRPLSWVVLGLLALALASCSRNADRPDIILVVLDTVRLDHTGLGPTGAAASVTPELDRFSAGGTAFTHAFANAPWTVPSHGSMFTGLLPTVHGCPATSGRFTTPRPTFAELLRDAGYETAAFYSNPFLSDEVTGLMRGFTTQELSGDPKSLEMLSAKDQGGAETLRNVDAWLDGREPGKPALLYVNFLEAHAPYDPPASYREEHLADLPPDDMLTTDWQFDHFAGLHPGGSVDWRRIRRLYAGDVASADGFFGELLGILRNHGSYDDAAIIVVSDHGENLGEHDRTGHWFAINEELLAVPVVVRAPGRLEPGVRDNPVELTDVFATVLDLASYRVPELPPHSRSLLEEPEPGARPLIAEYEGGLPEVVGHLRDLNPGLDTTPLTTAYATVRVGSMRLTIGSDRSVALHDMKNDPAQLRDLSGVEAPTVRMLTDLLSEVKRAPEEPAQIDERMKEWLRSLGYIQ